VLVEGTKILAVQPNIGAAGQRCVLAISRACAMAQSALDSSPDRIS
jgi:hypothetical protein